MSKSYREEQEELRSYFIDEYMDIAASFYFEGSDKSEIGNVDAPQWADKTLAKLNRVSRSTKLYNQDINDILDSVLTGMYVRDSEGNFVPLDDRYNVLRNEALESLQLLHEREVTEARISELRRMVVLLPSRYSQDLLDRIHEIRNDAKRAGLKEES